ncbi:transcriptional regulator, MerR family [Seinonella peptonophila]|uniref:Transcriptional regulator, MerR family n=1 Tax=Seinonella peptonophila TaxID=112248 RepID=A0A1M4VRL1_9BACL|nr:MerR family transcriptional regulator [Seinonella peptonophila]SHE71704.1 transcriptional regulator, MerR family [Seinonella peptonophila]
MYTIGQASKLTGFSPDTLRYYEKIGLLDTPQRGEGRARIYDKSSIQRIQALRCLKKAGLSLKDIKEFIHEEQCFKSNFTHLSDDELQIIRNRSKILSGHLNSIEEQVQQLNQIAESTKEQLRYYTQILSEHLDSQNKKETLT